MNPYAPPDENRPPERPRQAIVLPGWLVLAFASCGLLLPLAAVGNMPFGGKEMQIDQMVWAAMYGLPAVIAAFIFGVANLRQQRDVRLSRLGLIVGGSCIVALPLAIILR